MRPLLIVFLILLTIITQAQTRFKGRVLDKKNHPVRGASLAISDSYDGGTTDSLGHFDFTSTESGNKTLTVTGTGYNMQEQAVTMDGQLHEYEFNLRESLDELKAVVITAGSFEASDRKRTTVLTSLDIVTTASANADITSALKTLPGAQQVGESEGLFVRGGTAAETKTFIDGTLVNNFFYGGVPNIATRGRFSPFIFKGTVFSAGGYSALYGQALSSALILESIDLPEKSSANIGLSVLNASVGFQNLNKKKTASYGLTYSYTNLALAFAVIKQRPDYFVIPEYHNVDGNFRIKTSRTGMLKYYGYFSQNKVGVRNPSLDTLGYLQSYRLKNFNLYHNLSWHETLGHGWKINLGTSYTNNRDQVQSSLQNAQKQEAQLSGLQYKNFNLDSRGNYYNAKLVLDKRLSGLSVIHFGGEYNHAQDSSQFVAFNGSKFPYTLISRISSVFAESDIYLTNALAARVGLRGEHSALLDKSALAPRASLAYKAGKESQASLAYGVFYQDPERKYLPSNAGLNFTQATHYIAQFQKLSAEQTFRTELYYKKYKNLIKTALVNGQEQAVSNNGEGYARGFELFWRDKKTLKNVDYWMSYSYLDTKRDFLIYPSSLEPSFAAKHTANLVVKRFFAKMKTQINANYAYATGRPYYLILPDNSGKYVIKDQGRTIPYNSLSLSLNYLPDLFKQNSKRSTVFVLSVTNVLGTNQIYGYNYSFNGMRKEAIVPPSKTFVFLGAFISFGIDRSQDIINSNL